jgi:hypothetical protein
MTEPMTILLVVSSARQISSSVPHLLEQNACVENGLCLGFALRDQPAQSLALLAAEFDYRISC